MGRHPKNWQADQQENLDKQAEKATGEVLVTTVHKANINEIPVQSIPATEKKKLPKVMIATYNKHGDLTTQVFTCASINLQREESTILSEGAPTKRKDMIHIIIEADVVDVEP